MRSHIWTLLAMGLACAATGCGSGNSAKSAGGNSSEQPAATKQYAADKLPAVGSYLPPLDDGRIEIAPPADWKVRSRDSSYLAAFEEQSGKFPRITVTAWDTPLPEIQKLTEENAAKLAEQLGKDFQREKKTVVERPRPIILGETLFLRHVRRAKMASGGNVVVQALETVQGGRIYVVELIAEIDAPRAEQYEASLYKYRDYGYTVAAHLKFAGGESIEAPKPSPPSEPNPSDSSAE